MSAYINRKCYGFIRTKDAEFIQLPEEAAIVKLMCECCLNGYSLNQIIAVLESKRILSPSGRLIWSRKVISSVLFNDKYHIHGLISDEIFNMVQQEKDQRNASDRTLSKDSASVEEVFIEDTIQSNVYKCEGVVAEPVEIADISIRNESEQLPDVSASGIMGKAIHSQVIQMLDLHKFVKLGIDLSFLPCIDVID